MKKIIFLGISILIISIVIFVVWNYKGKIFTEDTGNKLEKQDLIRVSKPSSNEFIKSPLEIKGEARGYWFFEGDFPILLVDANGQNLGVAVAQTFSDWMTEDFISFEAILEFQQPETKTGTLILKKDNPSGLLEHDDELRIPINFNY